MSFKQLSHAALFFSLINLNNFGALKEEKEESWQELVAEYEEYIQKLNTKKKLLLNPEAEAFVDGACRGKIEVLKQALAAGIPIDFQGSETKSTALIGASHRGQFATVQFLLSQNANPDLTNKDGRTALIAAINELGAKRHLLGQSKGKDDEVKKYENIIDTLLRYKADPLQRFPGMPTAIAQSRFLPNVLEILRRHGY